MKIAYIELDTHAEIARQFYDLISVSKKIKSDFYLSPKVYQQSGIHGKNIHITDSGTISELLFKQQYDFVIIGTAHRYFSVFQQITDKFKTGIIVHNKNFSQQKTITLLFSVFKDDRLYRLKLLLKEGLFGVRKLYKSAQSRFVLDESLDDKNHTFLPIFYAENFETKPLTDFKRIVIPGNVSQKRRNYHQAIEKICKLKENIELILAGKTDKEELKFLRKSEKNLPKNIKLVYFKEKIPTGKFAEILQSADILWTPLIEKTSFFSVEEKYGTTKMSGTIGDAVRFSKKLIVPDWYQISHPFLVSESDYFSENKKIFKEDLFTEYSQEKVLQHIENVMFRIAAK